MIQLQIVAIIFSILQKKLPYAFKLMQKPTKPSNSETLKTYSGSIPPNSIAGNEMLSSVTRFRASQGIAVAFRELENTSSLMGVETGNHMQGYKVRLGQNSCS